MEKGETRLNMWYRNITVLMHIIISTQLVFSDKDKVH